MDKDNQKKSYDWLENWQNHTGRSFTKDYDSHYDLRYRKSLSERHNRYSRRFSIRLGYRVFLITSSLLIIFLLLVLSSRQKSDVKQGNLYISSASQSKELPKNRQLGLSSNIFVTSPKANRPLAGVKAKAYYLAPFDISSQSHAFEYNANRTLPIASISKLVTAAVALELMDKDSNVTISKTALSTEGNNGGFKVGDKIPLSEIIYPLLMVSSNDAAEAIAEKFGRTNFITAMNSWTWRIGAFSTSFDDPSGLSPNNISTAADLAKIIRYLMENHSELIDITTVKTRTFGKYTWTNPTNFLNMSNYIGGKNGFTNEASQTAVAIFDLKTPVSGYLDMVSGIGKKAIGQDAKTASSTRFVLVVLDSPTRDRDVLTLLKYIE